MAARYAILDSFADTMRYATSLSESAGLPANSERMSQDALLA